MRLPWKKVPAAQLDLLDESCDAASQLPRPALTESAGSTEDSPNVAQRTSAATLGLPLCVPIGLIDEILGDERHPLRAKLGFRGLRDLAALRAEQA